MADPSNIFAIDDLRILTGFDIEPGYRHRRGHLQPDRQAAVDWASNVAQNMEGDAPTGRGQRRRGPRHPGADRRGARSSSWSTASWPRRWTTRVRTSTSNPRPRNCVVRFRHDGVLHEIMTMPRRMQSGVLSRLKIMADLDIAERRVPQDGRIGLMVGGKPIDMRVA